VINNIIHGFGQSGIDLVSGEYFYLLHNLSYNNSGVTCDAQGSGIGIVAPKAFAEYRPTSADFAYGPFHNVVAWNVSHDNQLTNCGTAANPYDTDGNGIIMDTFNGAGSNNVIYPYQSLVAFNVTYRNGGKGIHVFNTNNVTVANNTAYDNNLDPFNRGQDRGEIDIAGGRNNFVINNIAYPVPATSTSDPRCQGTNPCYLKTNVAFLGGSNGGVTNHWSNNISFGGSAPFGLGPQGNVMRGNDTMKCSSGANSNQCNVDPGFTDPAAGNFALTAASPAIGYGLAQSYLSSQSLDAGACDHRLGACP
jgi:parallel beta-helix repeat protein